MIFIHTRSGNHQGSDLDLWLAWQPWETFQVTIEDSSLHQVDVWINLLAVARAIKEY